MAVATIVTRGGAHPVKTIEVLLNCIKEVSAGDYSVRGRPQIGARVFVQVDGLGTSILLDVLALLAFLLH